eukprot:TRINITY_DN4122_c0_g1_i1.p3 TRINITY_DN4122_c0_g1~~TRINITY_DN4122_c0_g1_i1.p3  ORF type:complete len:145 (-),score=37.48 TRINITY_DN4122_c0_g1_i1:175-546(-)
MGYDDDNAGYGEDSYGYDEAMGAEEHRPVSAAAIADMAKGRYQAPPSPSSPTAQDKSLSHVSDKGKRAKSAVPGRRKPQWSAGAGSAGTGVRVGKGKGKSKVGSSKSAREPGAGARLPSLGGK